MASEPLQRDLAEDAIKRKREERDNDDGADWIASNEVEPPLDSAAEAPTKAIDAFCAKHGLFAYLTLAKELARTCFRTRVTGCEVVPDYESDREWIELRVVIPGSVNHRGDQRIRRKMGRGCAVA